MQFDTLHCYKPVDSLISSDYNFPEEKPYYYLPKKNIVGIKKQLVYKESIFKNHLLKTQSIDATYFDQKQDWITCVLILILLLFSYVKAATNKRIKIIGLCLVSLRYISQLNREGSIFSQRGAVELFLIFITTSALFVYQIAIFYKLNLVSENGFIAYIVLCAGIFFLYSIKAILLRIIGAIFRLKKEFSEYILNVFVFNEAVGIALIPIVLGVSFLNFGKAVLLNIGICIFFASYIYRIFRGIEIGGANLKFSKFYLFLYLCALEVLPVIILIKIFTEYFR
ncbi:MAG: DUF4271 domain-containing protein [Bacteroidales bacterium]|jgi:hypothetical protein